MSTPATTIAHIRLLNGEILQQELSTRSAAHQLYHIKRAVADYLGQPYCLVTILEVDPEEPHDPDCPITHHAVIRPREVTLYPAQWENVMDRDIFFQNEDVVHYMTDHRFDDLATQHIASDPHPYFVEKFIQTYDPEHPEQFYNTFSMNPSDQALDFLFAHPDLISIRFLCRNPNRRAMDYLLQQGATTPHIDIMALLRQPYRDMIEFVIQHDTSLGRSHLWSHLGVMETLIETTHHSKLSEEDREWMYEQMEQHFENIPPYARRYCWASSKREDWLYSFIKFLESDPHHGQSPRDFPALRAFLRNSHPLAVEWILTHVLKDEPDKQFATAHNMALVYVQTEERIVKRICQKENHVILHPAILLSTHPHLIRANERWITDVLTKKWSHFSENSKRMFLATLRECKTESVLLAFILTDEVFSSLHAIDQLQLCSRVKDLHVRFQEEPL